MMRRYRFVLSWPVYLAFLSLILDEGDERGDVVPAEREDGGRINRRFLVLSRCYRRHHHRRFSFSWSYPRRTGRF